MLFYCQTMRKGIPMNKTSKLFDLEPMEQDIDLIYVKSVKKWIPVGPSWEKSGEIFVKGKGWVDTKKWKAVKRATLKPLEKITAAQLKTIKDQYGYEGAMAVIHGWGNQSLYHDGAYGLDYAKMELCNACDLGELYDKYTDEIQAVGDAFVKGLLDNGFRMEGKVLWYDKELVGYCGIYEKIHLHPLQHVDHCAGGYVVAGRILPVWNPMSFENMLFELFYSKYYMRNEEKYKEFRKRLDNMSVRDQIADLTTGEIADSFERIFEAQKKYLEEYEKSA